MFDSSSYAVASIARFFWGAVGMCLWNAGWGGILAGLAICDTGYWPYGFMFVWIPGCLSLVWLAAPTQRRYERFLRPKESPQGEMK